MMKTNFINKTFITKLIIALCILTCFISCNDDDDNTKIETTLCNTEQVTLQNANTVPFLDNFETYNTFATPSENWTSIIQDGLREFLVRTNQGNHFVEMTSFNSNDDNKTWLISPIFNFDTMIDKTMSFKLADAFNNGNPLKLMYSTNYNGSGCPNDTSFSWSEIGTTQIEALLNNTENDDFNFESSGDIDLSAINGSAVLAFVYQGRETDFDSPSIITKIQLDDVLIGQSLAFIPSLSINGNLEVGDTLTANYNPLIDAGGNPVNITYQWFRANDQNGANETLITGASNSTYVLTNDDSGKYITVKTTVDGNVLTANYIGEITGFNNAPTALVTINGTPVTDEILTADTSASNDPDGDPLTFVYQWYRANDSVGTNEIAISGETNATYTIVELDQDKWITVKVTANDGTFNSTQATATYIFIPLVGSNTPPIAQVSVTGSTNLGDALSADTNLSSDADGDTLTFTYQWYRADDDLGTNETAITGQMNSTYTVSNNDFGKYITVKVIANDGTDLSAEDTADYVFIPYSNRVFINELADPENETRGRFVELYNDSNVAVNLAGWKLIRYTNGGNTASAEEHFLIGTISANSTFVIGKVSDATTTTADFESIFGFAPDQAADPHSDGTVNKVVTPIDSNGDDQILLIAPNGITMDIFGVIGEDGSGTAHEFEDGKAVRKATVTQSNAVWDSNEWNVWNDTGAAGTTNDPQIAPADFTPGIR